MYSVKIITALLIVGIVGASPAALQRLYDAPSHSDGSNFVDHLDHSHDHGADFTDGHVTHHAVSHESHHTVTGDSSASHSPQSAGSVNNALDSDSSTDSPITDGLSKVDNLQRSFFSNKIGLPSVDPELSDNEKNSGINGKSVEQIISDASSSKDTSHDFVFGQSAGVSQNGAQLAGSLQGDGNLATLELARGLNLPSQEDLTITVEHTEDVYTTFTNIFYNTIPVTLTQFVKTTRVVPTLQIANTPVDDRVLVSTAPVTRTDTVTVTDTKTAYQFATEVSTDFYTITHRAYNILQQVVSSTLVQTQVLRPTIVSTVIFTEFETSTVRQTVTNTIVIESRPSTLSFPFGSNSGSFSSNIDLRGSGPIPSDFFLSTENSRLSFDPNEIELNHNILKQAQRSLIENAVETRADPSFLTVLLAGQDQLNESVVLSAEDRTRFQSDFRRQQILYAEKLKSFTTGSLGGHSHSGGSLKGHKHSGYHEARRYY